MKREGERGDMERKRRGFVEGVGPWWLERAREMKVVAGASAGVAELRELWIHELQMRDTTRGKEARYECDVT